MTDLSRWPEADAVLDRALDLPAAARPGFLEREVADPELREALARVLREDQDAFLEVGGGLRGSVFSDLEYRPSESPVRVGPYRLVREIGRGGMARVFEAEREDGEFERSVAVKLIRRTDRTEALLSRFQQERQILANLRHRSIAHLYEGGRTEEGEPYFVMELIDGEPIESHCQRLELDLRARLELFLRVAEAVSFAHRNLVVHRDIKSSNVLVDREGEVKLLDFGIAKVMGPSDTEPTATRSRMLTPEFASPEQLQGQAITTASDVYQLGHLLYRLLSHRSPYEGRTTTPIALHTAIVTETPPLPSVAAASLDSSGVPPWWKALRGDLDAVVMKALRKEPERRYRTVRELMDDVQAYLDGAPVRARPDSLAYRTRKAVLRHRAVAVVLALALTLISGLILAFAFRLSAERDLALAAARRAEAMTTFLEQLFLDANPHVSGRSLSAADLVERAPERIEQELEDQPLVQSMLFGLTGRLMNDLGEEDRSETWLVRAVDLSEGRGAEGAASLVGALRSLATLRIEQHREEEALDLLNRAEEVAATGVADVLGLERPRVLEVRARALVSLGRYDEAISLYEELRSAVTDGKLDVRFALHVREGFARALRLSKHDPDRAIALLEESLALREDHYGAHHPQLLSGLQDLAAAYGSRGFDARAEDPTAGGDDLRKVDELLRRALGISTHHFGESHPNAARICLLQGALAYADQDWDGVRSRYGRAVEIFDSLEGYRDDAALASMYLGVADLKSGHAARSIPVFERVLEVFEESTSANHWRVAGVFYYMGEAYFLGERWLQARESFEEARRRFSSGNGEDSPRARSAKLGVADSELRLAGQRRNEGRNKEAEAFFRSAVELYESIPDLVDDARQQHIDEVRRSVEQQTA